MCLRFFPSVFSFLFILYFECIFVIYYFRLLSVQFEMGIHQAHLTVWKSRRIWSSWSECVPLWETYSMCSFRVLFFTEINWLLLLFFAQILCRWYKSEWSGIKMLYIGRHNWRKDRKTWTSKHRTESLFEMFAPNKMTKTRFFFKKKAQEKNRIVCQLP